VIALSAILRYAGDQRSHFDGRSGDIFCYHPHLSTTIAHPMSEKFRTKKQSILSSLSRSGDDYTDASPKGSIDDGVRDLIALINDSQNFVTTSSCAGRIAVYLEGPSRPAASRAPPDNQDGPQSAPPETEPIPSTGGKGGGRWLFTSHSPLNLDTLASSGQLYRKFGFSFPSEVSYPSEKASPQFVHFKFEPMVSAKSLKDLKSKH
jgi:tRNA wybutosine-synthesizing protein 3